MHKAKTLLIAVVMLLPFVSNAQLNLAVRDTIVYPGLTCAGVWHYVDSLDNEYALVGVSDRISIVDVTNPNNIHEVFSVPALPGQSSLWREIKTYGKYAYAVSEGGGGVICIDLSLLPASISFNHWYGNNAINNQITSAHTVAATDGYLYVFGSTILGRGCLIASLDNPMNPNYVGAYSLNYIHDGYIRNDTLWAGEIYQGQFSVIDVSDKTNPVLLTTMPTPGQFCHNTWLSDDGTYLYTTDELQNVPLGAFNVHDINNIELVDVYYTDSMPTEEVHNVHVLNDYLINPSYGSQLTICDAARPENIVEVANYPTGPYLCWDASPYLPSGNIIATDMSGILYVFEPTYTRACYLEGFIKDSITGTALSQATIRIMNTSVVAQNKLDGTYATGIFAAGTYDIEISRLGYFTQTFTGVTLSNGLVTIIDAAMLPITSSVTVTNAQTSNPIQDAVLFLSNATSNFTAVSDANGIFSTTSLTTGTFEATVAKWGFVTYCDSVVLDGTTPVAFQLQPGYYDDFTTNEGWTISSTAQTGQWVREVPVGTSFQGVAVNPGSDVGNDCGSLAFITGNGGGSATNDDVDNGNTVLTSPVFDLSGYLNPYAEYETWLYMPNNISIGSYDTMFVSLSNGVTTAIIDTITNAMPMSQWITHSRRINQFITPTATMQLTVSIEDKLTGTNLLEGGFDKFRIVEMPVGIAENEKESLKIYPNPFNNSLTISLENFRTGDELVICDVTGREIAREKITSATQQVKSATQLLPGIYMLQVYSGNTLRATERIIRGE